MSEFGVLKRVENKLDEVIERLKRIEEKVDKIEHDLP
jgi:hypothetical protein